MARTDRLGKLKPCAHGSTTTEGVLDFSTNMYPVTLPAGIAAGLANALGCVGRYPDSESLALKEIISKKYHTSPEQIIAGNGSTELIRLIAFCFGDAVSFIPQPTFGEYGYSVLLSGGSVVSARIPEEEDFLVTKRILDEMPANTKLVFLCNPNNPTGRAIPQDAILAFLEKRDKDIIVVLDEVYQELSDIKSMTEKTAEYKNLIILKSLTKSYGLCGLRLGYAIADEKIIQTIGKARPPWNVNALAQKAGVLCINHPYLQKTREEAKSAKRFLLRKLGKLPLKTVPSETNFFLINVSETGYASSELARLLLARGVYVRDCSSFPHLDERYIRVGVKTREMNNILIEKLREVLE
jgi:histidinol-phosphate aminotransferase